MPLFETGALGWSQIWDLAECLDDWCLSHDLLTVFLETLPRINSITKHGERHAFTSHTLTLIFHTALIQPFLPYPTMSSSRADSRTNSVYVDAPEIASEDEASSLSTPIHQEPLSHPTAGTSATTSETPTGLYNSRSSQEPSVVPVTPIPQEEDEEEDEEDDEDDDNEDEAEYLDDSGSEDAVDDPSRGRSRDRDEDIQEDGDDDDEIIVMQADPATGLQRATSQTRSSSGASISSHMRRQQRRMASSNRVSSVRSGANGGTSSGASTAGSSSSNPNRTPVAPVVDEKAQSELRRKIMDIQRDPTISFADKAGMIQVLLGS